MMPVVLGIITARGGSKEVPGKNIKLLAGKPLIAWSIETALKSQFLDRVIVSADTEEIMDVAKQYGAEVPFRRPLRLSLDDSPHIQVILHALDWLEQEQGYLPDAVCLLQPTSPLRNSEDINNAILLRETRKVEAVVTVTKAVEHPYLLRQMDMDGKLQPFVQSNLDYPLRQNLPPAYFINGAVYVNTTESLKIKKTFYPGSTIGSIMPAERSLQIDTFWEFHLTSLIIKDRLGMRETIQPKTWN